MCTNSEWAAAHARYDAREPADPRDLDCDSIWYVIDYALDGDEWVEMAEETVGPVTEKEARSVAEGWNRLNSDPGTQYRAIEDIRRAIRDQADWE